MLNKKIFSYLITFLMLSISQVALADLPQAIRDNLKQIPGLKIYNDTKYPEDVVYSCDDKTYQVVSIPSKQIIINPTCTNIKAAYLGHVGYETLNRYRGARFHIDTDGIIVITEKLVQMHGTNYESLPEGDLRIHYSNFAFNKSKREKETSGNLRGSSDKEKLFGEILKHSPKAQIQAEEEEEEKKIYSSQKSSSNVIPGGPSVLNEPQ